MQVTEWNFVLSLMNKVAMWTPRVELKLLRELDLMKGKVNLYAKNSIWRLYGIRATNGLSYVEVYNRILNFH